MRKKMFIAMILRILITIAVYSFFGWLLCDIEPGKEYTWYSGIWHGLFFVVNWVRSWFSDALFKADVYTASYNVFYWIFSIFSVLGFIFGGSGKHSK